MSVLDRHPAPWTASLDRITDGNSGIPSNIELTDFADGTVVRVSNGRLEFASPGILRLILAAPELLAALKFLVDDMDSRGRGSAIPDETRAIIARIEGSK